MLKEVPIPQGVDVRKEGKSIVVRGSKGELTRTLSHPKVSINIKDDRLVLKSLDERRRSKAMAGTFAAHIKNMIYGVSRGYEARLRVVYRHFPVRMKAENNEFVIENFMGEKRPRIAKTLPDTVVKIDRDDIIVTGLDKEKIGITASRIEKITHITGYDKRVFSDGAYITQKPQPVGGEEELVPQSEQPSEPTEQQKEKSPKEEPEKKSEDVPTEAPKEPKK